MPVERILRPKLEESFVLDKYPSPINLIDFNVMTFAVLNWYQSKIEGKVPEKVGDELIKGCWALKINRGPDMLSRHNYRNIFVADKRDPETKNYWRDAVMTKCPIVQQAWVDHAEKIGVPLESIPTNYKGQRPEKPDAFFKVIKIGKAYVQAHFPFFEETGFEADDWCGALCRLSRQSSPDSVVKKRQILLNTVDRDWSQCVDDNERIYFANSRVPFPNERIQERLVGNQGVIEHTDHRMGFDISHPSELAQYKVLHSDKGDNLPAGTPVELFDLIEPHPEYYLEDLDQFQDFIECANDPLPNTKASHYDKIIREFVRVSVEPPTKI